MLNNFNQYALTTEVKLSGDEIGVFVREFTRSTYVIVKLSNIDEYTLSPNWYEFIESIEEFSVISKIMDIIDNSFKDTVDDRVIEELRDWFYMTFRGEFFDK